MLHESARVAELAGLAVLEGELPGGSESVLRRVAGTWALRPPQRVLLTLGTEPPALTICCESGSRNAAARPRSREQEIRRVRRELESLRRSGSRKHLAVRCGEWQAGVPTSNAARVAGSGRICFLESVVGRWSLVVGP
jgi:hypothetical protein